MERIGVYGGTFNPPHIGHIRGAKYAIDALQLEQLLLVPTCIAPHKAMPENSPTPDQRAEMLEISKGENMQVCDMELRRGGASYTYETLEALSQMYPGKELVLLMGTDMFLSFLTWKEPRKILNMASLGVMYRGDQDELEQIAQQKETLEKLGAKVYLVENPVTAISSTQLRRLLLFRCADSFLSREVGQYIQYHNLYGVAKNYRHLPMEALEQVVVSLLKPNRVAHVLGCRDTAVALAKRWGADPTDAARAGLLHDVTKALDGHLQLTLCNEYGIVLGEFSKKYTKTLHALTGSLVAERIFGENERVVDAIRSHTTGKPAMNTLEKILYVADYMEPNRDFPGVEKLRQLAYTDLDKALKLGLEMTVAMLQKNNQEISPASAEALAFLEQAGV
ncbi:MAG: nicotinate (nicotinamide) nucleotide adenylyltransferase [Oscillospiraceae bacterium]|nr:nicotinate (nicotinamide) nucleotide adenylyltransferase [Oscillospiraceae bacterium]